MVTSKERRNVLESLGFDERYGRKSFWDKWNSIGDLRRRIRLFIEVENRVNLLSTKVRIKKSYKNSVSLTSESYSNNTKKSWSL